MRQLTSPKDFVSKAPFPLQGGGFSLYTINMKLDKVEVARRFVGDEDVSYYIDLINRLEKDELDKFMVVQDGKRRTLIFGNYENDIKNKLLARHTMDVFSEEELVKLRSLMSKILDKIKNFYNVTDDLYMCSMFVAKQYPGAEVGMHSDVDNGVNLHFEYSAVLYLNTLKAGGELKFASLNYAHKPETGDLVFFPSKTTGMHYVKPFQEERYSLCFWTTKDKNFELK